MADLSKLTAAIPGGGVKRYQGTVVTVDGERLVNVGGNNLRATWSDPLVVDDGDTVTVDVTSGSVGQGDVFVVGRSTLQPRPKTGSVTAVPASSQTITVLGSDGVTYDAEFGGTYLAGDNVHLDWGAGRPRVIMKVSTTAAPPPPPPPTPPPAPVQSTGSQSAPAIASGSFWGPGGWGSWAGGGTTVFQGSYGSSPVYGSWFYGSPFTNLSGRHITRIRFRTGQRKPVGSHNTPVVFHFYAHDSPSAPGGDVNRIVGPYDVTIQPGQPATTIDLPVSFGPALVSGGGISIAGEPYAAMDGITQPDSGALILDWSL